MATERICKKCGMTFLISPEEMEMYTKKNMSVPRMCSGCRGEVVRLQEKEKFGKVEQTNRKRIYVLLAILVVVLIAAVIMGIKTINGL